MRSPTPVMLLSCIRRAVAIINIISFIVVTQTTAQNTYCDWEYKYNPERTSNSIGAQKYVNNYWKCKIDPDNTTLINSPKFRSPWVLFDTNSGHFKHANAQQLLAHANSACAQFPDTPHAVNADVYVPQITRQLIGSVKDYSQRLRDLCVFHGFSDIYLAHCARSQSACAIPDETECLNAFTMGIIHSHSYGGSVVGATHGGLVSQMGVAYDARQMILFHPSEFHTDRRTGGGLRADNTCDGIFESLESRAAFWRWRRIRHPGQYNLIELCMYDKFFVCRASSKASHDKIQAGYRSEIMEELTLGFNTIYVSLQPLRTYRSTGSAIVNLVTLLMDQQSYSSGGHHYHTHRQRLSRRRTLGDSDSDSDSDRGIDVEHDNEKAAAVKKPKRNLLSTVNILPEKPCTLMFGKNVQTSIMTLAAGAAASAAGNGNSNINPGFPFVSIDFEINHVLDDNTFHMYISYSNNDTHRYLFPANLLAHRTSEICVGFNFSSALTTHLLTVQYQSVRESYPFPVEEYTNVLGHETYSVSVARACKYPIVIEHSDEFSNTGKCVLV